MTVVYKTYKHINDTYYKRYTIAIVTVMVAVSTANHFIRKHFQYSHNHYHSKRHDLMYSFQNGFHHDKGHIVLLKLGISALGHQSPILVTLI